MLIPQGGNTSLYMRMKTRFTSLHSSFRLHFVTVIPLRAPLCGVYRIFVNYNNDSHFHDQ